MEYRGGDTNYLSKTFAVSTMLKFTLRKIQQDFNLVIPFDIELEDSFKVENNMVFIPPQSTIRKELQKDSAYEGIKNKNIQTYAKNYYKFIKGEVYKEYRPLLKPIKSMLEKKETLSDEMIKRAKRKGFDGNLILAITPRWH